MRSDPGAALALLAHKTRLFLRADEILRNQQIYPFREDSVILKILLWIHGIGFPFGLVLPFAAAGMIAIALDRRPRSRSGSDQAADGRWQSRSGSDGAADERRQSRSGTDGAADAQRQSGSGSDRAGAGFLFVLVLAYAASVIAFFVTARYRLPIVPVLLIFAGAGAQGFREALRDRRRPGRAVALGLAFLVAGVIANAGLPAMPAQFNSDAHSDLGFTYQVNGDRASARREYERALALDPENHEARNNLAGLLAETGDHAQAVLHLRAILEAHPEDRKVLANLGRIYLALGRPYDAGASFDRLARLEPAAPAAASGLAAAREMADRVEADEMAADPERFLESLRQAAAADPDDRFLRERLRKLTAPSAP
jgi:tetratricopeptide (TPR) repeat protein